MSRDVVWLFGRGLMDAPKVDTFAIRRFLDYLGREVGAGYLLLTTNWDFLLQREIDVAFSAPWPKIKGVFHLNGTVEDRLYANRSRNSSGSRSYLSSEGTACALRCDRIALPR